MRIPSRAEVIAMLAADAARNPDVVADLADLAATLPATAGEGQPVGELVAVLDAAILRSRLIIVPDADL